MTLLDGFYFDVLQQPAWLYLLPCLIVLLILEILRKSPGALVVSTGARLKLLARRAPLSGAVRFVGGDGRSHGRLSDSERSGRCGGYHALCGCVGKHGPTGLSHRSR